jgi:thioredoxin reductase
MSTSVFLPRIPLLLRRGHRVTVISQSSTYCYSGMAPGVLGGQYGGNDIILDIKAIVEGFGAGFVPQKVVHIDPQNRRLTLEDGSSETYDTVSFNIGSRIQVEGLSLDPGRTIPAKPIINFLKIRERVEFLLGENRRPRIIVAGGGPAGLEIAANLCRLAERRSQTLEVTLISSGPLLSALPGGARRSAVKALEKAGVRIMEGCRLTAVEDRQVGLLDGSKLEADLVVIATGNQAPESFHGFRTTGGRRRRIVGEQVSSERRSSGNFRRRGLCDARKRSISQNRCGGLPAESGDNPKRHRRPGTRKIISFSSTKIVPADIQSRQRARSDGEGPALVQRTFGIPNQGCHRYKIYRPFEAFRGRRLRHYVNGRLRPSFSMSSKTSAATGREK